MDGGGGGETRKMREREKEKLWMDGMWEGGEEDFDWGDGEGTKGKGGEKTYKIYYSRHPKYSIW